MSKIKTTKSARRHPAQRIESPARGLSAVVHLAGLTSFAFSYKFLIENPNEVSESYGWHFQFLTIIGLLLATATFVFGLLADISLSPSLFRAKNALSVTSAPMEVLISVLYWSIRSIDPALVKSPSLPPLPFYADFGFHAAPAIFLVLDFMLLSPPWSVSAFPALALSGAIAVAYWFWVEHCHSHNGFYPYPIFDIDREHRMGLFAMSAIVMSMSTFSLKWCYARINGLGMDDLGHAGRKKAQ